MRTLVSLSQEYRAGMNLYPGEKHGFLLNSVTEHGFKTSDLSMGVHLGTHVDMPMHILAGETDTASASPDTFFGRGFKAAVAAGPGAKVIPFRELQIPETTEFLLLETGWSRHWGTDRYFSEFPYFSTDWIPFLRSLKLKGIGTDTPSLDCLEDFPFHRELLPGRVFYENLTNLQKLPEVFDFYGLPLRLSGAEASPVRCFALF